MESESYGLRYERLLLFAAPLTAAAFVVLAVALASATQADRIKASCYETAAEEIESKISILASQWELAKPVKAGYWGGDYRLAFQKLFIHRFLGTQCYAILNDEVDRRYREPPGAIAQKLRADAASLRAQPLKLYGIDMPDRASFVFGESKVSVDLLTFTRALQIVLFPLLLLWLGSLYNTRYREGILNYGKRDISQIFPHVLNVYPVGKYREPRKRDAFAPYRPRIDAFIFTSVRVGLLSLFIGPAVGAYLASLWLLSEAKYLPAFGVTGLTVMIFLLMNYLGEFWPWHFNKVFPPPAGWKLDQR